MTPDRQRHPTNDEIEKARTQRIHETIAAASELRSQTARLVDWLEFEVLDYADIRGMADREGFLTYVVALLSNRVLERRLTP